MGISSPFPAQLLTDENLPDRTANVDLVTANDMNLVRAALRDMSACLGINPHGSAADLATRLSARLNQDGSIKPIHNVRTVGASNCDFTTIQAAINSITDSDESNQYSILIAPGLYEENLTLKNGINLVGISPPVIGVGNWMHPLVKIKPSSGKALVLPELYYASLSNVQLETSYEHTVELEDDATLSIFGTNIRCMNSSYAAAYMNSGSKIESTLSKIYQQSMGWKAITTPSGSDRTININARYSHIRGILECNFTGEAGVSGVFVNSEITGGIIAPGGYNNLSFHNSRAIGIDRSPLAIGADSETIVYMNYTKLVSNTHVTPIERLGTSGTVYLTSKFCQFDAAFGAGVEEQISSPVNIIDTDMYDSANYC